MAQWTFSTIDAAIEAVMSQVVTAGCRRSAFRLSWNKGY